MEELSDLTNETFDNLLEDYFRETETYNHFEFGIEFAREATGYGTIAELLETADLGDYTGYEPEEMETAQDFEYNEFLMQETADKFVHDLNDGMSTLNLTNIPYFNEFYEDFMHTIKYEGTKEDFEYSLRRSVDFFNFVVDITSLEE